MLLKKIYTSPEELFEPVRFKDGINYIFGKKEEADGPQKKNPLNGIGKSTFLDLIDYALCASFSNDNAKRLRAAYESGILKGISINLEFEVDEIVYIITRSFDEPKKVFFSEKDATPVEYSLDNIKPYLCNLVFQRDSYNGIFSDNWFRQLMPFFIKIQPPEKYPFQNPILYIQEQSEMSLNQYHFFLLNMDNSLSYANCELQLQLRNIQTTIRQTKKIITQTYGVENTTQIKNRIRNIEIEIEKLENSIKDFKLTEKFKIDEVRANKLTTQIKELWFDNDLDKQKLDDYEGSLKMDLDVHTSSIKKLYAEFNELLGESVKKTLDEAIKFRKNLISSRTEFIQEEIDRLKEEIDKRDKLINKKEDERAKIFKILKSKKAITDLTEAYYSINQKRETLTDLKSRTRILTDLQKKGVDLNTEISQIYSKILDFKEAINQQEYVFSKYILEVYNSLYPELKDTSIFDISPNQKSQAKIQFNILTNNEMFSKGRNQSRTLIYDLSVLFHAIDQNIKMPRFLIHDGILDGVDKTQFIHLVEYLEEQHLEGKRFQYIMTINEEGTLEQKFGNADKVNPTTLEKEARLVLTQNKKLLAPSFDVVLGES
ncbi:MAG: DUF2326 domain-containing protein [Melioribacteraceae bacterium]|nr:DUF2326 domain-containing protein [Melioribacteraceae bacterium]